MKVTINFNTFTLTVPLAMPCARQEPSPLAPRLLVLDLIETWPEEIKRIIQNNEELFRSPPAALMQYLKDYPQITEIALHLDNDTPGRLAAAAIKVILPSAYTISDEPPQRGKDYNDYLRIILRIRQLNRMEK